MNSKLTLKLNTVSIERAKRCARKRNTSLSRLVEGFFDDLADRETMAEYTPIVRELSGIAQPVNNIEIKSDREEYLVRKHLP